MDIMDMIIDRMNKAHKHSKYNETELKNSYICGCYFNAIYLPSESPSAYAK